MEKNNNAVLLVAFCLMGTPRGIFIPLVRSVTHPSPLLKIPGGGKLFGEEDFVAALREFHEETAINTSGKLQGYELLETVIKKDGHKQIVMGCCLEDIEIPDKTQPIQDGEEFLVTELISFKDIASYLKRNEMPDSFEGFGILPGHADILRTVLQGKMLNLYEEA